MSLLDDEVMSAFFDAEVFGVPVTFAGAPADLVGIKRFFDQAVLGNEERGAVTARVRTVRLPTAAAQLLAPGMAITVNGVNYTVRDPRAFEEGSTTFVALRG
ncbi:MAG TPA: hypothetical protein VFK04_12960 [Gemmatimonadaceae bacterium]|nr:hypothetical protein [Gemmatimonadaceae bacterium]